MNNLSFYHLNSVFLLLAIAVPIYLVFFFPLLIASAFFKELLLHTFSLKFPPNLCLNIVKITSGICTIGVLWAVFKMIRPEKGDSKVEQIDKQFVATYFNEPMERNSEEEASTETTRWFKHELSFERCSLDAVSSALQKSIISKGFKTSKKSSGASYFSIGAIYGSRATAISLHLIPFVGRHLPPGKRCFLEAHVVTEGNKAKVKISATPYMELFDNEEITGFTQSIEERATDEYFTASKLYKIIQSLHSELGYPLPERYKKIKIKPFAKDTFWRFLLYPHESFRSPKPIYKPTERGPLWCWGAFVVPEIWFLWHEIWGAAILSFLIETLIARFTFSGFYSVFAGMTVVRLMTGYWGHRIFYFRHGRWAP